MKNIISTLNGPVRRPETVSKPATEFKRALVALLAAFKKVLNEQRALDDETADRQWLGYQDGKPESGQ